MLFDGHFADYRLLINGLVEHPIELTLTQLRALPHHEQITQHFCIQGWLGIAKWGESQLGFKQVNWIKGIEFSAHFAEVGGGYGGYNQDHEFFGCAEAFSRSSQQRHRLSLCIPTLPSLIKGISSLYIADCG